MTREYRPRPDQIEAVMVRCACTYETAVQICVGNFTRWRDRPRKWKAMTSWYGGSVLAEVR